MKGILKHSLASLAMTSLLVSPLAQATNGYFKIGAGSKNRGLAGAGIAYGQDSLASAINPATLSEVGNRFDAGAELFKPKRSGELDATGIGGADSAEKSRSNGFFLPNVGFSKAWTDRITIGISAIGNGGMNTRYGNPDTGVGNIYTDALAPAVPGFVAATITQLGGDPNDPNDPITQQVGANAGAIATDPNITPSLGVNLAQLLVAPTIAYKITQHQSVGFAPVIGYQTFRAYGLGLFKGLSSDPTKVTNNGNDSAFGIGARIGYQGTFGMLSVGAVATSKIYMEKFDKYAGLFAGKGDFDIPATAGVGLALHASSKLTIAADATRIFYSQVDAISNKGPTANEFFTGLGTALAAGPANSGALIPNALGTSDGYGFGWDDIWVYKIGVNYAWNSDWTLRAGFNYAKVPYDDDQALFNILAPAVVEKHITAGFTRTLGKDSDITFTYMHALRNDVEYTYSGTGPFTGFSYTAKNDMYQNAFEVSYGKRF